MAELTKALVARMAVQAVHHMIASGGRPGTSREALRFGSWAVRTADLPQGEMLAAVAVGVVAAAYGVPAVGSVGPAIAAACKTVMQMRNKGAPLDPLQQSLVAALKQRPMSEQDLRDQLNATARDGSWSASEISEGLKGLAAMQLRDGTTAAFTARSNGVWRSLV